MNYTLHGLHSGLPTTTQVSDSAFNPLVAILPYLTSTVVDQPFLDFLWIAVMYSILHVSRFGEPRHRISGMKLCLSLHIATCTYEVIRFHTVALSAPPTMSLVPAIAGVFTAASGFLLARKLETARAKLMRPFYQIGGAARLVTVMYGYFTGSASICRFCILPAHAFIYARLLVPVLAPVMGSKADAYALGTVVASVLGLMEAGAGTLSVKAYLVSIIGLSYLSSWVSARIEDPKRTLPLPLWMSVFFLPGFVNVETIKRYRISPVTWQVVAMEGL